MFYISKPRYIARSIILIDLVTYLLKGESSSRSLNLFIVFAQLALVLIFNTVIYPSLLSPFRKLPGPPQAAPPFIGHAGKFYQLLAEPEKLTRWLASFGEGDLLRYRGFGDCETLVVNSPEAMAEVMSKRSYDFIKPPAFTSYIIDIVGNSLLLSEGDKHRIERKALMPAFSFRHINDLKPIFHQKAQELIDCIKDHTEVTVTDWSHRVTFDIIGLAGFGHDFGTLKNPNERLALAYQKLFSASGSTAFFTVLSSIIGADAVRALPLKAMRDRASAVRTIRAGIFERIQSLRFKPASTQPNIASVALSSGSFSDADVLEQMLTFLVAGHDTTSSAFSWCILKLCQHPDMQAKIWSDASYLSAFCKEVLRRHTPVINSQRQAAVDTFIGDQFVPKGTNVDLVPYLMNTDRRYWGEDAMEFRPERWVEDASGGVSTNYANSTFLHGPRSCIGERFSRLELEVMLTAWVKAFQTELVGDKSDLSLEHSPPFKPKRIVVRISKRWEKS